MLGLVGPIQAPPPDKLLRTVRASIQYLTWTKSGKLIVVTQGAVTEFPSGRSRPLRRSNHGISDPNFRNTTSLRMNAGHTKAIGNGFVLDLRSLVSTPLPCLGVWDGDRLIKLGSTSRGHYRVLNSNPPIPIAPDWYVLGLSNDLRLALACRKEPFDGDRTYLLRIDPKTGRASPLSSYPNASDDHNWLCQVQKGGPKRQVIAHSINRAGDLATPYFAGSKLRPLPRHPNATTSTIDWISPSTPWTIARQTLLFENPNQAAFVDTLDLWNSQTGVRKRIKSAPSLGPIAVDWPRRRLAYSVKTPKGTQIFIHVLSR